MAVNPIVGLGDRRFIEAAHLIQKVGYGEMLMPSGFCHEAITEKRMQRNDFQMTNELADKPLPAAWSHRMDFTSFEGLTRALAACLAPMTPMHPFSFAGFLHRQLLSITGWSIRHEHNS